MSKKNTKRALLSSVLALVLCFAMLTGTTFAWFTDSVTSGKNQIVAGNLDVELEHTNEFVANDDVEGDTNLFCDKYGNPILWEPGVVVWENLTVKNVGNLALKYDLFINFDNENATIDGYKLSQVLKIAVVDPIVPGTSREDVLAAAKATGVSLASFVLPETLLAGEEDVYGLVIYWEPGPNDNNWNLNNNKQTTDGVDYLHIDLGITLQATQVDHENDSFGNDYDEGLLYGDHYATPANLQEIIYAAEPGDIIVLENGTYGDIVIADASGNAKKGLTLVTKNAVVASVNLNGSVDITLDGLTFDASKGTTVWSYRQGNTTDSGTVASIVDATEGRSYYGAQRITVKNCVFKDASEIATAATRTYVCIATGNYRSSQENQDYTIENCTFSCNAQQYLQLNYINGNVVVKNNVFGGGNYGTTHNTINSTSSGANWTITGNTFNNWNPLKAAIGSSRSTIAGVLTWTVTGNTFNNKADSVIFALKAKSYNASNTTVVVENNTALGGEATLVATTRNAEDDEDIFNGMKISTSGVTYAGTTEELKAAAKTENATVYVPAGEYNGVSLGKGVTIIAEEGTVIRPSAGGSSALGSTHNTTVKNVTFAGNHAQRYAYASGTVVFENCTFVGEGTESLSWALHYDGASGADILYKDCTIIGWAAMAGDYNSLTFEGCDFYGNGAFGLIRSYGSYTLKDCTFDYSAVNNDGKRSVGIEVFDATLNIINCKNVNGEIADIISYKYASNAAYTPVAVIVDGTYHVATESMLDNAIAAGAKDIYVAQGEYNLAGILSNGLTITGASRDVKFAHSGNFAGNSGMVGAITKAVNLKNMTLTNTVFTMEDGGNATFTNVYLAGGFREGYGSHVAFTDCTFGSNSEGYALHFQSASSSAGGLITIDGCEFEGGKVHLGGKRAYAFTGCDFAAGTDFQVWSTVTLTGCTVDGEPVTAENAATFFPKLNLANVTFG